MKSPIIKSQLRELSGDDRLEIESNLAFVENELTRLTQHLEEIKKQVRKEMELHLGKLRSCTIPESVSWERV